ncbi:MAG: glycosyltransferase family 4 protein [Acidobacteriota bacterium]
MDFDENEKSLSLLRKIKEMPSGTVELLSRGVREIAREAGIQAAYNLLLRAEVAIGRRRPTLGLYDHAFHLIGGAQKYGLTLAAALLDRFETTIISNKEVTADDFRSWYNLDLSSCRFKLIRIPFYEERGTVFLDPALVTAKMANPFHPVSKESGAYDIFVNNSMNEMVFPLSNISALICHFPERRPKTYFYADQYTAVIYNSRYTAEWVGKRWKFVPHEHIYPPVDPAEKQDASLKKKIILSVARFEPEGTKRQREMIGAFLKLSEIYPAAVKDWTFILAGGSEPQNRYLEELRKMAQSSPLRNVELRVNIPAAELASLYEEASIFWHLCGVVQNDPSEVEHFGMTTVEAMQRQAVPVVYDGGGLGEIVDDGVNGYLVRTRAELLERTFRLFRQPELRLKLGQAAAEKARVFSRAHFEVRVRAFFDRLLETYRDPEST